MSKTIPVSVIIPCFNCETTLERAVQSVLTQSKLPGEILLIDDCSTDGTRRIISQLVAANPQVTIRALDNRSNQGPAATRNRGWAMATSPYIAFLDADDTWHPDKLKIQYEFMTSRPDLTMSGHRLTESEVTVSPEFHPIFRTFDHMLLKNHFSTPSVMLKRDIPERFPEDQRYSEDYALWLEIAHNHGPIAEIPLPLVRLYKPKWGASGASARIFEMERGELRNYWRLRTQAKISLPRALGLSAFSLAKFAKRLAGYPALKLRNTLNARPGT